MGVKIGFLLVAILAGCLAGPIPNNDFIDSELFYHTDPNARIVGGTEAAEGSVPYMVAMTHGVLIQSFICGGSILTQRTVLTAAHCIVAVFSGGSLTSSLRVTVGTNTWNRGGQIYSLERNVTYPNYIASTIKNDIGLLITSENMIFSELVSPAILNYDFVDGGILSRAAGWGRIRQGGALSTTLLELFVTTIDGDQCIREVAQGAIDHGTNSPEIDPSVELCTVHSPDHGMCNGDSGSALVRVDRQQQIGIVSWGIPCARGAPDMFVRVSAFREWLVANVA